MTDVSVGLISCLDNIDSVVVICLDFAKGLDNVPHPRLLGKLTSRGILGNA